MFYFLGSDLSYLDGFDEYEETAKIAKLEKRPNFPAVNHAFYICWTWKFNAFDQIKKYL
jgi:hypothetical protein